MILWISLETVGRAAGAESGHMNLGYLSQLRALKTSVALRGQSFLS